ncbi:MAG: hypothetical protein M0002_18850 [Rhodospirillales bacterium]|nr:hypothetical protein [Rhodospirillales bacterium]
MIRARAKVGMVLFVAGFWPLSVAVETMSPWGYWLLAALVCFFYGHRFMVEEERQAMVRRLDAMDKDLERLLARTGIMEEDRRDMLRRLHAGENER